MSFCEKIIVSGNYNNKSIIALLNIEGEEYTYEKIFFNNDKLTHAIHSMLVYNDQIFLVDSYNGVVYKYSIKDKNSFKVTVGKDPRHIARLEERLFVTNFESNSVSVIDLNKLYLIESVPAGIKPHAILTDEEENKIFVASYEENLIIEYNDITKNKICYKTEGKPIHADIYKNRLFVLTYILNGNVSSTLNIIDLHENTIKKPFNVKGLVTNIKYDLSHDCVYMINIEDRYLYCADLNKNEIKKVVFLGGYPEDIVIGSKKIFITNSKKKNLIIIDKETRKIDNYVTLGFSPECIIKANH